MIISEHLTEAAAMDASNSSIARDTVTNIMCVCTLHIYKYVRILLWPNKRYDYIMQTAYNT
jgi:hypothetical protein